MRNHLKNVDWDTLFKNETDVNIIWDKLESEILDARDKFIPRRILKKQQ